LDRGEFSAGIRSAGRGSAPGPSGWRFEHLRILLAEDESRDQLADAAERLARGDVSAHIADAIGLGRIVALRKPDGGVRGLVVGDTLRRATAKCLARQFAPDFTDATAPFQFALGTRSGAESAVFLLRALAEADDDLVLLSLDGIGAFDHVRRDRMLDKLRQLPAASAMLPFVRLFYGRPSTYVWSDANGHTHDVRQGDGGEQGDALMPALFSLGIADSLTRAANQLGAYGAPHPIPDPHAPAHSGRPPLLAAFLDDIYVLAPRAIAGRAFNTVATAVEEGAGIRTHLGKLQAWSSSVGPPPPGLPAPAPGNPPIWKSDPQLPAAQRGLVALGIPVGSDEFVAAHGVRRSADERSLLAAIPALADPQSEWLLLRFCAEPRANHLLRAVPPAAAQPYAAAHDDGLTQALQALLGLESPMPAASLARAALPGRLGGLGLRSARRSSTPAYVAGVAGALPIITARFPTLGQQLLDWLDADGGPSPSLRAAHASRARLDAALGEAAARARAAGRPPALERCPAWSDFAYGLTAPAPDRDVPGADPEPGEWRHGWQFVFADAVERAALHALLQRLSPPDEAMMRSQAGAHAADWLAALPACPLLTLEPAAFSIALRRRLRLPLAVTETHCPGPTCRAAHDPFGDHAAACMRSGRVQRRAVPVEDAWRIVLAEAGGRGVRKRLLREFVRGLPASDGRNIDAWATGLPIRQGLPLAVDATVRSVLTGDGRVRPGVAHGGSTFPAALRDKLATYPELGPGGALAGRVCFVVAAVELGGRWHPDACSLVKELTAAVAARQAPLLRRSSQLALSRRWWGILSCAVQRAFAASLDERVLCPSGTPPPVDSWALLEEVPLDALGPPDVSLLR